MGVVLVAHLSMNDHALSTCNGRLQYRTVRVKEIDDPGFYLRIYGTQTFNPQMRMNNSYYSMAIKIGGVKISWIAKMASKFKIRGY